MCNPIAMMSMSLLQTQGEAELLEAQREQTESSYRMAAQSEGVRRDKEALAIRMEADKIGREVRRVAGTTTTEMAGAGVSIPMLVEQWSQIEAEKLGALSAKDNMLALAGDMRMQELVNKRDQRLAAQAGPTNMDWIMAATTGYIQGKLIQQQLTPTTDAQGKPLPEVPQSEYTPMQKFESWMDDFLSFEWGFDFFASFNKD